MKQLSIIFITLFSLSFLSGCGYNKLVTSEEAVNGAWAQVENVYQRRADLIPNLVETVKGYAAHEKETLEAVIQARSNLTKVTLTPQDLTDPSKVEQFQKAQSELSSTLSRLMLVVEKYPDLKANEGFLALQSQLEGTENRISVERMRFNEVSQAYNTLRRSFPTVITAKIFDFNEKAYFKADEGASKPPSVKFN